MHQMVPSAKQIEAMKRSAKQYKRNHGCTHGEALNIIAHEHYWPSWPLLMRAFNASQREGA